MNSEGVRKGSIAEEEPLSLHHTIGGLEVTELKLESKGPVTYFLHKDGFFWKDRRKGGYGFGHCKVCRLISNTMNEVLFTVFIDGYYYNSMARENVVVAGVSGLGSLITYYPSSRELFSTEKVQIGESPVVSRFIDPEKLRTIEALTGELPPVSVSLPSSKMPLKLPSRERVALSIIKNGLWETALGLELPEQLVRYYAFARRESIPRGLMEISKAGSLPLPYIPQTIRFTTRLLTLSTMELITSLWLNPYEVLGRIKEYTPQVSLITPEEI